MAGMDGLTAVIILSVTMILVFILNSFCILVILRNKKLRENPSTILTVNLLVMHLIQAVFVMPFYAAKRYLNNSSIICDGFRFFYLVTFYIACFNVLLISLDRFLAFKLKMKYKTTVTCKRVLMILAIVWVYIIALCCVPFAYPKSKCHYNPNPTWVVFMLLANCFVPCVVIILIYVYISLHLHSFSSRRSSTNTISNTNKKITRNTFILVITYGLAWTPSIIYYIIQALFPDVFSKEYYDSDIEKYVSFFLKYAKFAEGVTSPILYCYLNSYFKKSLSNTGCCCTINTSSVEAVQKTSIGSAPNVLKVVPVHDNKALQS